MSQPHSFRDVIELWPSHVALASEIGAPATAVRKWAQRDRIPSEWWQAIISSPLARAGGVSAALLAGFAAATKPGVEA